MGKFFDKFKGVSKDIDNKVNRIAQERRDRVPRGNGRTHGRVQESVGSDLYDEDGLPKDDDIYDEDGLPKDDDIYDEDD